MHPLSLPKVYYAFVQGSVCVRVCWDWMEDILKQYSPGVYESLHSEGFPL